jgi:hypothetical protein
LLPTTGANTAMPTGRVFMLSLKVTISGQRRLFQLSVKTITVAAIAGARASAKAIRQKIWKRPAPSMIAASSSRRTAPAATASPSCRPRD